MLNRNTQYSEWLLPYLEGGLDEARRAQLEARLAVDPALADEARQLARTLGGLRGAASRAPRPDNAQVPADLWPHLRARLVLDPAPRPRARVWWLAGVGAPAAAALIVAAFWLPGWHTLPQPPLAPQLAAAPRSVIAPKAAVTSPAAPVTPKSAVPPAMTAPAPLAKPVQAANVGAAKPGAAVLSAPPAAPPASPFDLPAPAPPTVRAAKGLSPQVAPSPSAAGAVQAAHPPVVTPPPPPAMAPAPAPLKPAPPAMAPPAMAPATAQGRAAPTPDAIAPAVAAGAAGVAGAAAGLVPKEIKSGPPGGTAHSAKAQPNAMRFAAPPPAADAAPAFVPDGAAGLDSWQASLSAAVRSPLWGENEGDAQANQALTSVRESGMLDDLRARLEARRAESPHDVVTGRMLAAVYEFGFSKEAALRERRRVSGLEGAVGEDWYALAQAEERAGSGTAARAAYRRALESPVPPSAFHAAIARGKA